MKEFPTPVTHAGDTKPLAVPPLNVCARLFHVIRFFLCDFKTGGGFWAISLQLQRIRAEVLA